ncbi:MAG TPA: hypothetical protein VL069_13340 [Opitutus sp.]|nr:hypothetical protein [Opitutus sp.]
MKTSLKTTALVIAAAFPCAAFAQILGANLPAPLTVENTATFFSMLLICLTLVSEYSRPSRSAFARNYARFTEGKGETHRLAA